MSVQGHENLDEGSSMGAKGTMDSRLGSQQNSNVRSTAIPTNISVASFKTSTPKMFSLTPATAVGGIIHCLRPLRL